jgi:hypothetical protein
MSLQQALEAAVDLSAQLSPLPPFSFSTLYWGSKTGNLIAMINGTANTIGAFAPFYYWQLSINGQVIPTSIDAIQLQPSDAVVFTWTTLTPSEAKARFSFKSAKPKKAAPAKRPAAKAKR